MLQANDEDGDFFKEFEISKKEVFKWIRDEHHLRGTSRLQRRDTDAVNGDTWYRNYQIKECQGSNKSSFCNGQQHVGHEADRAPEISELFDMLEKGKSTQSDGGKLQAQTHRSDGADGKNIQHLLSFGDHRDLAGSNYGPIEARLSAKQFLAKEQNAVHEIELKHSKHLPADNDGEASEKILNGNQLPDRSLNSNFPLTFNLDTSKRSTSQLQKLETAARTPDQHFDDQLNQKKNDLFDEVDEKLSKKEQQSLVFQPLHRVKRRDVNEINRSMTSEKNYFYDSNEIRDGKSN